ncbi:TAF5-like protein [Mya arenaria]|uniref:TAF5-like protein n=1 Tax=Mya arenaria TaxID=6604 RepID=A0ABY7EHY6_MYAAR|nr:TAF5-like protein [Mya arenaria]
MTILYPVFVHMYLELVYNGHEHHAKKFFLKYSLDQEPYYAEDLNKLSTVTKPEHMKGSQIMENFKSSKFVLKMSRDSYTHLKLFDGVPRTKHQIDMTSGGLLGEAARDANKTKILHGLLKEPDINIPVDDDDDGGGDGEDKPKARFLPLYLRTHGMSLSNISFFKLLLIPWMLKALWAPFVDKYGTKKKWLMYSMFGLFTTCLFGMFSTPDHLYGLALVLFLFNFLTATQDIAVDGLAVQILATSELAAGNIAQVVWYKIGAVFSGGLLIWLTETFKLRWGTIFLNVGIFYFCAFVFVTKVVPSVKFSQLEMEIMPVKNEENKEENIPTSKQEKGSSKPKNERHWLLEHFKAVFSSKETRWTLGYVLIYKLASTVEFWTGIVGQATSIFGSLLGGWLVSWFKNCGATNVYHVARQWCSHNNDLHLDDVLFTKVTKCNSGQPLHYHGNRRSPGQTDILRSDWFICRHIWILFGFSVVCYIGCFGLACFNELSFEFKRNVEQYWK